MYDKTTDYLYGLIKEFLAMPTETEWLEFKLNNESPDEIGEYISALGNSATLMGKHFAYLIWGVENKTHKVIGTTFNPKESKVGNEELENWLLRLLSKRTHFIFYSFDYLGSPIVILEIQHASESTIQFKNEEYIRVGSYKKKLKDYPALEKDLWRSFDKTPFESDIAIENVTSEVVLKMLDYPAYFDLLGLNLPDDKNGILHYLEQDNIIQKSIAGKYNITNLGAVLFAKKLDEFRTLKRKAVRVIVYKGNGRIETTREQIGSKGYASGFEGLISFIDNLIPKNEVIGKALRKDVSMYPELAVRELVANALIHQDFSIKGTSPTIEIFDNRIEITNPGKPLINIERFVDNPPKSRNEELASLMRRCGICEERGSGFDKVVSQTEYYQLPPPKIDVYDEFTKVTLYSHILFSQMSKLERIQACYLHACLKQVNKEFATNPSLRERFNIQEKNRSMISRLIKETIEAGLVKLADPNASDKTKKYLPFWA
ncbi:MAG: ATP-binding protein [bacterium]